MNEARDAAKMTRGLADIVDTRGNDFLDLMSTFSSEGKVHIFWEGHKILRNLLFTFDCMYCSQK